jgi:hypothetical protein
MFALDHLDSADAALHTPEQQRACHPTVPHDRKTSCVNARAACTNCRARRAGAPHNGMWVRGRAAVAYVQSALADEIRIN